MCEQGQIIMNSIQRLISGYLDDELVDDERSELAHILVSDAESLERLVSYSFIHFQLLHWMDEQRLQDRATAPAFAASNTRHLAADRRAVSNSHNKSPAGDTRAWTRLWSLGAIAAVLLVAISISGLTYTIASRPTIVGQLTHASGCRWDKSQPNLRVGALVQDGQELSLLKGSAMITFVNGVQVLLEAPASLRLDSTNNVYLRKGRVAAKVPTQARGFTVTSSLARFVDLGTAFTLKLDAEDAFELHVFEGLVELQLDKRFGEAVHQPVRVAEVCAVSFDVEVGDVAPLKFKEGKKMPF